MVNSSKRARTTESVEIDEVKAFSLTVWNYKMGEQVALMIHLGDQLGLYRALVGAGPISSEALAESTDLDERLVREWLLGQAAAKLIERHDDGLFELTKIQAAVLADEDDSLLFAAGVFRGGTDPATVKGLIESFRTGTGLSYDQQGTSAAAGMARMTGPWSRLALTTTILPALDGVLAKLNAGARVIDIGCGAGVAVTTIAKEFPQTTCIGYDPSETAITMARRRAKDMALSNVSFLNQGAATLPPSSDADLVLCFDCLHDMPRPDLALRAIRGALAEDGTLLVKDIRSTGNFSTDAKNPVHALLYGFSVATCLQSGLSEPGGLGLGTLGLHPERLRELSTEAGFGSMIRHDFDDAANLYYELAV